MVDKAGDYIWAASAANSAGSTIGGD
jgi:hypothetical protein